MRMRGLRQGTAANKLKKMLFLLGSRGPGSRWYGGYRLGQLIQSMSIPFQEAHLPAGYGRWIDERIVEYPWLFSRLPEGAGKLLDAGSILNHRFVICHPKLRGKELIILTLAPEPDCFWRQGVSYVYGDLRNLIFRDNTFDFVTCISTLEHVGLDNRRFHSNSVEQGSRDPESFVSAVEELRRVLKPGGRCFVSVPFGRHEVKDWQQVFDGPMVERLVQSFAPRSHEATYFLYGGEGWTASDPRSAAAARYFHFASDMPWKGHPAAAGAVACLDLRK